MLKIIVPKNTYLFFMAFLCIGSIYAQKPQFPSCNPYVSNQLILQFDPGVDRTTINNRLINGQVIKSLHVEILPSSPFPLNIHLAEFNQKPGIRDLNGNPQIFSTVEELLIYLELNEACNGGIDGTGNGKNKVRATDLNYRYSINNNIYTTSSNSSSNYDMKRYTPAPNCNNVPIINNLENLNTPMTIAIIDGGYTNSSNYRGLFNQEYGHDFIDGTNVPNDITNTNHGDKITAIVAGTLCSAAGSNVNQFFELYAYKVLNEDNEGELFDLILAVNRAIENGAQIINLSLGMFYCPFDICSVVLDEVFDHANDEGVIIIAAAGNDEANIDQSGQFYIPGSLTHKNMIVVGAAESCLQDIVTFSNTGRKNVDLFAEGVNIPTNFGSSTGTSFSAPYLTGIAALAGAKMQEYNHEAVICAILGGTDYKGWNQQCKTGGVLNATKTLNHSCLNNFNTPATTRQSLKMEHTLLSPTMHPFFSSEESLNISVNAMKDGVSSISIFTITGKLLRSAQLAVAKGDNDLQIHHLNEIPSGLYIVQAKIGEKIIIKKCYKNY